jgi:hypothetical protein
VLQFVDILTLLIVTQDFGGIAATNTGVQDALVARYAQVWADTDWPFKFVPPANINLTSGTQTVAAPAAMLKPIYVFDDQDNVLSWMDPREFFTSFGSLAASSTGRPVAYTFADKTLYFGPTPNSSYTFTICYERKLSIFDSGNAYKVGPWDKSNVTDRPAWDENFHYLLLHGVWASMLGYMQSPDAAWHEQQFRSYIDSMERFYAPFQRTENAQFRRDALS